MSVILAMDPHHPHHQEPGSGFPDNGGQWMGQHSGYHSQHQSPVHEYSGFVYNQMPIETSLYPGAGSMAPPRQTHLQLQPLIMPQTQWPSMLKSQSPYSQPMLASATVPSAPQSVPVSTPLSAPPTTGGRQPTPRKTLTDDDRRRMCLYAEQHPTVKQTEIGAMFGVERSTVSKVLRNKEKYLYQDDGSRSPARKAKGKFPDIERALSNWAKNHQKQGLPLTDALIKDKLRAFATTVGNSECIPKASNHSWLEKFKQKNNLMGSKSRKNSIVEEVENGSNPASGAQTPSNVSATSPPPASNREKSPSILLSSKSHDNLKEESPPLYSESHGHRPFHSLSNDSLASSFAAGLSPSFSPGPASPTSSYFASDFGASFVPQSRNPSGNTSQSRPRSQTFPMLGVEPYVSPPSSEPLTPKYVSSTVLDSPLAEMPLVEEAHASSSGTMSMQPPPPPSGLHQIQSTPMQIPISRSPSMLQSSPITPSSAVGTIPPGSPTLEDTRRALEVVINFFQHQPQDIANSGELMAMGALMEKLRLRTGTSPIVRGGEMPGGMHRIHSGDFKTARTMGE